MLNINNNIAPASALSQNTGNLNTLNQAIGAMPTSNNLDIQSLLPLILQLIQLLQQSSQGGNNDTGHNCPANPDTPASGSATDDSVFTPFDTPTRINVVSNDEGGNNNTVASFEQPANGAVTGEGNDLVYTPNPGFTGTDSFTYTNSNGAAANVSVQVGSSATPATTTPAPAATTPAATTPAATAPAPATTPAPTDAAPVTPAATTPAPTAPAAPAAATPALPAFNIADGPGTSQRFGSDVMFVVNDDGTATLGGSAASMTYTGVVVHPDGRITAEAGTGTSIRGEAEMAKQHTDGNALVVEDGRLFTWLATSGDYGVAVTPKTPAPATPAPAAPAATTPVPTDAAPVTPAATTPAPTALAPAVPAATPALPAFNIADGSGTSQRFGSDVMFVVNDDGTATLGGSSASMTYTGVVVHPDGRITAEAGTGTSIRGEAEMAKQHTDGNALVVEDGRLFTWLATSGDYGAEVTPK